MTDFPVGSLPYGYHILAGYPIENDTEDGMEASIVYVGPATYRWLFLEEVFGRWETDYHEEVVGEVLKAFQCATLVKEPKPYHLQSGRTEEIEGEQVPILYDHLWPDTFTIRPIGDPAPIIEPYTGLEILERPLDYDCLSEITVNYRSKCHAGFPTWCYPLYNRVGVHPLTDCYDDNPCQACFSMPPAFGETIPVGTFVDVRKRQQVQFQTIPGRELEYDPGEDGWPPGKDTKVPEDVNFPLIVTSVDLEIEWSNVPTVPVTEIAVCEGKINAMPFMGYPAESVLFLGADIHAKKPFYNRFNNVAIAKSTELYSILYKFNVQTVLGIHGYPDSGTCFGQMGYFNRRHSVYPIPGDSNVLTGIPWWSEGIDYPPGSMVRMLVEGTEGGRESYIATGYVLAGIEPGVGIGEQLWQKVESNFRLVKEIGTDNLPYKTADFNTLFTIKSCP